MIVKKEEKEARLRTAHTLLDNIRIFSDGMCRGTVKTFNSSKYRMIESQLGKDAHVYPNGDCYFYLVDNMDKDFHDHLSGMCNRLAFLFTVLLPDILKENESATIHIKYKENKILLSKYNQLGWVEVYPDASYFRCTGYRFEKFSTKIWEVRDQLSHIKKLVGEATHIIIYYDWDERMKSHYSRVIGYKWSEVDGTICAGTESLSLKREFEFKKEFEFKIGEDMKQTSKLTRNQRHFLESRGIKDTTNLRFCKEDKHVFVYFNKEDGKVYSINK